MPGEGSGFRNPSLWLALLSLIATSLSAYVGLRLEPLHNRMVKLETEVQERNAASQGYLNDYIAFKAQTIEILRQQNETIREVREDTRRLRRGQ